MNIIDAQYLISSPSIALCPPPMYPEYAFIGRSNVGKSSLINMLTGKQKLAKTSGTPGKTQLINHFKVKSKADGNAPEEVWYMVDLPGFGFAKRSKSTREKWSKMTELYIRERENLMQLFLLIDSRHTPQKIDLEFANNLYQWHISYTIIFTKTDKSNQRTVSKHIQLFKDALLKTQQFLPRMIATSSLKNHGRNQVLQTIHELNTEWVK